MLKFIRLNKIFPITETTRLMQFWQRRFLVNPLSDIPNRPIKNNDNILITREKISIGVICMIIPM